MRDAYLTLDKVGQLAIKDSNINMLAELTSHQELLANDLGDTLANAV